MIGVIMGTRGTLLAFKNFETGPVLESFDLDKSWHGLHFLLSGAAAPIAGTAGFLRNGQKLDDPDDAEVYFHSAAEVAEFNTLLTQTTARLLRDRYDAARMRALDIYPQLNWDQSDFDYLVAYYNGLRPFVQRHADFGHELMVMIC